MRLTRVDHVEQTRHRRLRGDEGAALVEMTLVALFLMFLLFGIVMFGFLMSFRQNVTQAAAEGARAGAVATYDPSFGPAISAASIGTSNAVAQFLSSGCAHANMKCDVVITGAGAPPPPAGVDLSKLKPCNSNTGTCVTVLVSFINVQGPNGLLPSIPLVGAFIPDQVSAQASAAVYTS